MTNYNKILIALLLGISLLVPASHHNARPVDPTDRTAARIESHPIPDTVYPAGETAVSRIRNREDLDTFILDLMNTHHVPGLAACIVKNGKMLWTGTYGYANIEEHRPVQKGTLFELASVSKTVTTTALMQLYEAGLFGLDDDINGYLPFAVRNPAHPADAITFRMLLTHTSSIRDNWDLMRYYWGSDSPIPLDEYLWNYLTPQGKYYFPDKNYYTDMRPGTSWHYSNIGIVVAGYLVEAISGVPFDQRCEDHIFTPLGMDETSWFLAGLDPAHIAMPYHWDGSEYVPYGFFGYSDYPAGQLRTSVDQLACFLISYIQQGEYQGARILDSATVDLILTVQLPDLNNSQGLVWFYQNLLGRYLWGHTGGDFGIATRMHFDPSTGIGVITLSNGETQYPLRLIQDRLFEFAENYSGMWQIQKLEALK